MHFRNFSCRCIVVVVACVAFVLLRKENCIYASWNGLTFVYFTANYDGKQFMELGWRKKIVFGIGNAFKTNKHVFARINDAAYEYDEDEEKRHFF